jgi:hypothetical protein
VTATSGTLSAGYGMGVATGDYDNDGWPLGNTSRFVKATVAQFRM